MPFQAPGGKKFVWWLVAGLIAAVVVTMVTVIAVVASRGSRKIPQTAEPNQRVSGTAVPPSGSQSGLPESPLTSQPSTPQSHQDAQPGIQHPANSQPAQSGSQPNNNPPQSPQPSPSSPSGPKPPPNTPQGSQPTSNATLLSSPPVTSLLSPASQPASSTPPATVDPSAPTIPTPSVTPPPSSSPPTLTIQSAWGMAKQIINSDPFGDIAPLKALIQSLYDKKSITTKDVEWGYSAEYFVERAKISALSGLDARFSDIESRRRNNKPRTDVQDQADYDEYKKEWTLFKRLYDSLAHKPNNRRLRENLDFANFDAFIRDYHGVQFERSTRKVMANVSEELRQRFYLLHRLPGPNNPFAGTFKDAVDNVIPKLDNSCRRRCRILEAVYALLLDVEQVPTQEMLLQPFSLVPDFQHYPEGNCFAYPGVTGPTPADYITSMKAHLVDELEKQLDVAIVEAVQASPELTDAQLLSRLNHLMQWKQAVWPVGKQFKNLFLARVVNEANPDDRMEFARTYCGWKQSQTSITKYGKHVDIENMVRDGWAIAHSDDATKMAAQQAKSVKSLVAAHPKVFLSSGDIVKFRVDAIVNAANEPLAGGGGIDGAIHLAFSGAGTTATNSTKTLLELIKQKIKPQHCPCGEVRPLVVQGENLRTSEKNAGGVGSHASDYIKAIVLAVGPVYTSQEPLKCAERLSSVYREILNAADALGIRSIAVCGISAVIYGYPTDEATLIAMRTAKQWTLDNPDSNLQLIFMNSFTANEKTTYGQQYRAVILS